jgi:hypothetical protein
MRMSRLGTSIEQRVRMPERMDHEKMRRAAETKVTEPAATDPVGASGGLELPGRANESAVPRPIPGEHDHTTEAPTQPGIVGTTGYGADLPPELTDDPTLTDEERKQVRWEAGGRVPRTDR